MSEWYENQKKPSSNTRKLLQERIEKAKPFPTAKPPTTSAATPTPQATPNCAVRTQSITSKDIGDIRTDYLKKQSELQPIKPQSPSHSF